MDRKKPIFTVEDQEGYNDIWVSNKYINFCRDPVPELKRESYWNARIDKLNNNGEALDKVSNYFIKAIQYWKLNPNFFVGIHGRTDKLVEIIRDKWDKGYTSKKGTLLLVDITSTGTSLLEKAGELRENGLSICSIITLLDRMYKTPISEEDVEGRAVDDIKVINRFKRAYKKMCGKEYDHPGGVSIRRIFDGIQSPIPYHAIGNASTLLPLAYRAYCNDEFIGNKISGEYRRCGVEPIRLDSIIKGERD